MAPKRKIVLRAVAICLAPVGLALLGLALVGLAQRCVYRAASGGVGGGGDEATAAAVCSPIPVQCAWLPICACISPPWHSDETCSQDESGDIHVVIMYP